jgi:hypothetical protein
MVTSRPRWSIAPYFVVDDVVATANFYRDKMGFDYERFWGDPPCFCMAVCEPANLGLITFDEVAKRRLVAGL